MQAVEATIVCPLCKKASRESMPHAACQRLYECGGCGELLGPKPGDCCVFCSYSDQLCPPKAAEIGGVGSPRVELQ